MRTPEPAGPAAGAPEPRPTFPPLAPLAPLTDGTLTLRPLTAEDWPVVLAEHDNPEQLRWGFTDVLAAWVFAETAFARLELGHKAGNVASGLVAERAGFVREGVHRARLPNADGTRSDEVCWALVRPA